MCAMLSGLFIAGDNGRPPQAHKQKLVTLNTKYVLHNVELERASAAKYIGVRPSLMTAHGLHILIILQRKPIKPLDVLKETYSSIIRTWNQLLIKPLPGHSWSMLQLYGTPTTTNVLLKLKQSKEGLQGGQQETIIDTPSALLLS